MLARSAIAMAAFRSGLGLYSIQQSVLRPRLVLADREMTTSEFSTMPSLPCDWPHGIAWSRVTLPVWSSFQQHILSSRWVANDAGCCAGKTRAGTTVATSFQMASSRGCCSAHLWPWSAPACMSASCLARLAHTSRCQRSRSLPWIGLRSQSLPNPAPAAGHR